MADIQHVPAWVPDGVVVEDVRVNVHNQTGIHYTAVKVKFPAFDGTQHCAGMDLGMFYGEGDLPSMLPIRSNIPLCDGCPFRVQCREWGIAHEQHGIWGGIGNGDRERIRNLRKQGFWSRQNEVNDSIESWAIALGVFRAQAEAYGSESDSDAA